MKIEWWIEDGYVNRKTNYKLEIPDEDLEDLTEEKQNEVIDTYVYDALFNEITLGWRKL